MSMTSTRRMLVAGSLLILVLGSCGIQSEDRVLLRVSAASSLTDVFTEIEAAFETANPGVDVVLNLAGSALLREQIAAGAPAAVLASADPMSMQELVDTGFVAGVPVAFATNTMQIAVPLGNPGRVKGLEDFGREGLLIGLCGAGVPCGDLARKVLDAAGVTPNIDTNEPNVRSLLTKIESGELDAGIVYTTDVMSAGESVIGVEIPGPLNATTVYPIAVVASELDTQARLFVEFVVSDAGRRILVEHGFGIP